MNRDKLAFIPYITLSVLFIAFILSITNIGVYRYRYNNAVASLYSATEKYNGMVDTHEHSNHWIVSFRPSSPVDEGFFTEIDRWIRNAPSDVYLSLVFDGPVDLVALKTHCWKGRVEYIRFGPSAQLESSAVAELKQVLDVDDIEVETHSIAGKVLKGMSESRHTNE